MICMLWLRGLDVTGDEDGDGHGGGETSTGQLGEDCEMPRCRGAGNTGMLGFHLLWGVWGVEILYDAGW